MLKPNLQLITLAAVILGVASLLAIAVSNARTTARKMQSQNNLKQLGLGLQNFESANKRLPAGCDPEARHGWMTRLMPYLEATDWYSGVDFDVDWEHPLNRHHFGLHVPHLCVPNQALVYTADGYGITGYQANQWVLHRGVGAKFADLVSGMSHTILVGESTHHATPFAYPFNWRDPMATLGSGPDSFGAWRDGAHFVLADGSVRFMLKDVDPNIMSSLSAASPLLSDELRTSIARPDREFQLVVDNYYSTREYFLGERSFTKAGPAYSQVVLTRDGQPHLIDFRHGMVRVGEVFKEFSRTRALRTAFPQTVEELNLIVACTELETLCFLNEPVGAVQSTRPRLELRQTIAGLQKLPKLRRLKLELSDEQFNELRQALPNCEVERSSASAPRFLRW